MLRATIASLLVASPVLLNAADPVTTRTDKVGKLLNEWAATGTAAGLSALTYENRDAGHSMLNLHEWPGLKTHTFSEQDRAAGLSKGPARMLRDTPTLGNCSMAAPADRGGSLSRFYFMDPGGTLFLTKQYLANQLFIYPEHQDYDPGGNGVGGWGDLFTTHSPAVLISQGSSGSDQPFLKALLSTIAALPADIQSTLIERRLLAPTLQQLLRRHSHLVSRDADYLSGKAHPIVFAASDLDEMKMVLAANRMTRGGIPPLIFIDIQQETKFEPGKHFFEPANPHPWQTATSPVAISRVFRGNQPEYECFITTHGSWDLLGRPLTFHTVVLQGDPGQIKIEPESGGLRTRLRIRWQPPESTTRPDSLVRSHRVDIGFFADNGVTISAPSIFSLYMLPNERRYYDANGRVAEIAYQASNPDLGLPADATDPRWLDVIRACTLPADTLPGTLMQRAMEAVERAWLIVAHSRLTLIQQELATLQKNPAAKEDADRQRRHLDAVLQTTLDTPLPGTRKLTARKTMETALHSIARFTDLYPSLKSDLDDLAARSPKPDATSALQSEVQKLIDWGILIRHNDGRITPQHSKESRPAAEDDYLKALNFSLLSHVLYPAALTRDPGPAWVDPRLSTRKDWRDVMRYDEKSGSLLGWTRHIGGRTASFDTEGRWFNEADPVRVEYLTDPATGLRFEPAK